MEETEFYLSPDWASQFPEVVCGFTKKKIGNLAHTRMSIISGKTTAENKQFLKDVLNIKDFAIFSPLQVHSNEVAIVNEDIRNKGEFSKDDAIQSDACLTMSKNILLLTTWADCVPVILYEFNKKIVASVHSGWKSTYKQIVPNVIDKIVNSGGRIENIYAAVGPAIKKCCYEVGSEFEKYFGEYPESFRYDKDKVFFDPSLTVYKQLISKGIKKEKIEYFDYCTCCSSKPDFFSYRKDKDLFEGQGAFIGMHKCNLS